MTRSDDDPGRVLAVAAHPDDLEFGAAGTVARWVDRGWEVHYAIVTSGQRGVQDVRRDPVEFGILREEEARKAAAVCGVASVTFLRFMDSEVAYGPALLESLSREFRRRRPHRLLAMKADPILGEAFINHPDHRFVGQAALDITVSGGTTAAIFPHLLLEEGFEPWRGLEEIWLMGPGDEGDAVDITGTIDRKIEALLAHESQVGEMDVDAFVREFTAANGRAEGYAHAERFRILPVGLAPGTGPE